MHFLGVDIGGTTIKAGRVDQDGRVLAATRVPTTVDDLGGFVRSLIELIAEYQSSGPITAVGIGIPGLQSRDGMVETSPNVPCLRHVPIGTIVAGAVRLPVITENDANVAAYCEYSCGLGVGKKYMAYLTLGTGLGSGLILNGQLYRGTSGYAAEFGHTVVEPGGRPCACGGQGCLETIVSATGIVQTARELGLRAPDSQALTSEYVYLAASHGDPLAIAVFEKTGRYLGIGCANLINLLNLELIALGGGVMAAGEAILGPTRSEAARRALAPSFADCRIVQSELWPEAGVIGAAMLARDLLK